jgi:hypothetical protein
MITLQSVSHVDGVSGSQIFDFLMNADDAAYQRWWPGVHLQFHALRRIPGDVGTVVFMDEFVGRRRVRLYGVVVEAAPGKRITWQLKKGVLLPAWLTLELVDQADRVEIRHTVRAGLEGVGRILNPLVRLYFSRSFAADLDKHVRTEFPKLESLLAGAPRTPAGYSAPSSTA